MYNNIPINSKSPAATVYSNAYEKPLELETNTFNLMKGFFESRGFDKLASDILATTFIRQAVADNYKPLEVLSTLKNLDKKQFNSVVIEILNFNRYKTSYLGSNFNVKQFEPVARNIVA